MPAEGSPFSNDQARPQGQAQMMGRMLKQGGQDAELLHGDDNAEQ